MKTLTCATLLIASMLPNIGYTADADSQMERITVTYRTPFEYALYQYTTETLQAFNQQVLMDIQIQARLSSMQMAKEHGVMTNELSKANESNKTLISSRTLKSAE